MKATPHLIIEPRSGWRLIDWRELVDYRDLFFFLVWRDVKALYKQSVLGFGWAIVQPLVNMLLFTMIFGRLAGVSTDGAPGPLFYFTALVPWTYFSNSLSGSSTSLVSQANLLSKVYVPRLVIPMTAVLAKLVDFAIAFGVLIILVAVYHWTVPAFTFAYSPALLLFPLLLLLVMLTTTGIGLWLSALAVQYRDVKFALPFLTQILMYAAPVVWPASLLPDHLRPLVGLYPMFGVIEGFRAALLATHPIPWDLIGAGFVGALLVSVSGAFVFRRQERWFADVA